MLYHENIHSSESTASDSFALPQAQRVRNLVRAPGLTRTLCSMTLRSYIQLHSVHNHMTAYAPPYRMRQCLSSHAHHYISTSHMLATLFFLTTSLVTQEDRLSPHLPAVP